METSKMLKPVFLALLSAVLFSPSFADAYEAKSGLVKRLIVNAPVISNRSVIVELHGVSQMCSISSGYDVGYFNKADLPDTFSSFVSTLLTAQATGRAVLVFTTPGAEGCRIDQVQLDMN